MSVDDCNSLVAHLKCDENGGWAKPHLLLDHVQNTAELAGKFASVFNSADWAYAAGKSTVSSIRMSHALIRPRRAK